MHNPKSIVAAFALTGCCSAPSGMPPAKAPDDVEARLEALPVEGRGVCSGMFVDESFQIGEYSVSDVDRSATTSMSVGFNPWRSEKKSSGLFFRVSTEGTVMNGACRSTSSRSTEWDGSISSKEGLGSREKSSYDFYECICSGDGKETTLEINGTGTFQAAFVSRNDKEVHVKRRGTIYLAEIDEAPWLAVSLGRQSGLWLDPSLDEQARAGLSCVVAGWMLR